MATSVLEVREAAVGVGDEGRWGLVVWVVAARRSRGSEPTVRQRRRELDVQTVAE